MFYCDECDREVTDKEMYFDYEDNAFRHKECGQSVQYCSNSR